MRKISLLLLLSGLSTCVLAQNKLLTIQDAMIYARGTLAPEDLRGIQFIHNSHDYVYYKQDKDQVVYLKGGLGNEAKPFLTLQSLNEKLSKTGLKPVERMPLIQFGSEAGWVFFYEGQKLALNPEKNEVKVLADKSLSSVETVESGSDGYTAYLEKHNLWVTKGSLRKQLTNDGSENIVYGSAVHRNEFGIDKGLFWSTSGKKLAFYRMDQSMVQDYPIIDWTKTPALNKNIKYPMAGDKSHHVKVGVYDAISDRLVYLETGEPSEQYLTNIAWSPDDRFVYIAVVNREQNHMWLRQYDSLTGKYIKTLFEEKDDKYTEPLVPMSFVKNDAKKFIWQSNRDGWNHLYLYNADGSLLKQLTKGNWEVTEVKGYDEKGEKLFYMSTEESPITRNLYSVNLKTGKRERLTEGFYNHRVLLSSDGKVMIDNFSGPEKPREIQLKDLVSKRSELLLQAKSPLAGFATGESNIFKFKTGEGIELYGTLFKPANFDPARKYPVVVYWYGGPHAQLISNSWNSGSGDYWFQYMAERGFVVLNLDTRGSDNRGKAFEQSIFRNAGKAQAEDLLNAVNYLKSLPYVNTESMGLFGWSYGGFNTVNFMLEHPGVFQAAVAGGPVTDWRLYEVMYTERYMDTPQENPEGYKSTNLIGKVQNLKGKLLLIHGLQDDVVVQQHSVNFVKAAVDKGVQVDYMIYPGHAHNVIGKDRAHLYQKVSDYFLNNLLESKKTLGN
ncbi:S9 family peptidase [Desertivirga arenae]|uniref:S9 family peptidase n=1 Tax=Desertivirga arenae TaxID=2810309 RepID=UPI001A9652BB|nr:DPP IV N-terminal domain-containing protein [Pedobacter sp. SYSU D00823]